MKVRVKFSKLGSMKYIGHLDVMRYFQKAIRRAGIDIKYSNGFSPHQIMSFASPLGIGNHSIGEYMDIELNTAQVPYDMKNRLNTQMVEGIEVLSVRELPEDSKNAMSIVTAADYEVEIKENYRDRIPLSKIDAFYNQSEIFILKKSKKSEREVDIKPMIYDISAGGNLVKMRLATGSALNLKPELVMEAFFGYLKQEVKELSYQVKRLELFTDIENGDKRKFITLESLGNVI